MVYAIGNASRAIAFGAGWLLYPLFVIATVVVVFINLHLASSRLVLLLTLFLRLLRRMRRLRWRRGVNGRKRWRMVCRLRRVISIIDVSLLLRAACLGSIRRGSLYLRGLRSHPFGRRGTARRFVVVKALALFIIRRGFLSRAVIILPFTQTLRSSRSSLIPIASSRLRSSKS